jgi:uncharacterized membrane protein
MVLIGTVMSACVVDNVPSESTNSVSSTTGETAAADPCEGVPLVNWDTFGSAFITHECQVCHGSWVVDRFDAPEEVTFDTVEEVWARAERILVRATGESSTMPPNGGTFEDDQVKLAWWLTCAPYGT